VSPASRERAFLLAAGIFLALWVVLIARGLWKGGLFEEGRSNDFRAYHLAAAGVWDRDLLPAYLDRERPYWYPPTFAFLVAPLGLLPYRAALPFWVAGNAFLVAWVFRALERVLGLPLPPIAKLAGFLLVYRLVEGDFANGNANVLVLAIVLLAFDLARRGREALGGGALALAALAKVSPILVVPWVLYRGRWRMLAGVLAGLVLLGAVLPALVLGPAGAGRAWSAWAEMTIGTLDPTAPPDPRGYEPGQSLRALVHRLLRHSDATAHDDEAVSVHIADIPRPAADLVYIAAAGVVLIGLLAAWWRRAPGLRLGWQAGEVAAACAAAALLAPLSRKAHFVLLWPAAVLGFEAWRRSEGRGARRAGAVLWGLAFLLVAGTSSGVLGKPLSARVLAFCPMSWAAALLLVLVSHPRFFPRGGRTAADLAGPCGPASSVGAVPSPPVLRIPETPREAPGPA
jgi:hypothetical protein